MTLAADLLTATASFSLPKCPSDQTKRFHECLGTFTFANGDKYVGEFRDSRFNGRGTYAWAPGNKYVGEFRDGKMHGQGAYTYASGSKYVGEFRDDKSHGQGTHTFASGSKYVGEFRDDKKHGQGTYYFPDGSKEVGTFRKNKLDGYATQYRSDGSITREGIFKDDKFLHTFKNPVNVSSPNNSSKVDKSKSTCAEIGFTPGTQEFGQCVLKIMDVE